MEDTQRQMPGYMRPSEFADHLLDDLSRGDKRMLNKLVSQMSVFKEAQEAPDKNKWDVNPCEFCSPKQYLDENLPRQCCSYCGRGK